MNKKEQIKNNWSIAALIKNSSISLTGEVIKKFFQGLSENLGKLILINLLWFFFAIPLFTLIFIKSVISSTNFFVLFFSFLILLAPATASVFNLTFQMIEGRNPKVVSEFFRGFRIYCKKGIVLSVITIALFAIGFTDMWFYANLKPFNLLSVILVALGFLVVLLIGLMQNYLFPLMVQKNLSIKDNLLNSIYFTFDSIGFSFVIFLLSLAILLILSLSGVGVPMLFMSLSSFLYNLAFRILLVKKYGIEGEIAKIDAKSIYELYFKRR